MQHYFTVVYDPSLSTDRYEPRSETKVVIYVVSYCEFEVLRKMC